MNDNEGISHEIWAAAQLVPGEGIEDGVSRIVSILAAPTSPATVDPTDPGHEVEVLREHVRHLERRVRQLAIPAAQAQPVAWMRPDTEEVATDARKRMWLSSGGGYESIARRFTKPLYDAAPEALAPEVAPTQPAQADERATFEAWAESQGYATLKANGAYLDRGACHAWFGWRAARAALTPRPAAPINWTTATEATDAMRAADKEMRRFHEADDALVEDGWTWDGDQWQRPSEAREPLSDEQIDIPARLQHGSEKK